MNEKVYINNEFKAELTNLNCGFGEDYITITRREGDKVFFQYGKCKLHVTKAELEEAKLNAEKIINETIDTWEDGGIHFGFNIARVFTIKKAKKLGW